MAVRLFDGVDDVITFDNGAVTSLASAHSFVCVTNPTALGAAGEFWYMALGGATELAGLYDDSTAKIALGGIGDSTASVGLTAGAWQVIGYSKAAGTIAPRLHRAVVGVGSWTHVNGGTALASPGTTVTDFIIGAINATGGSAKDMTLAVAAVFTRELSDAEFVSIVDQTSDIYNVSGGPPSALWQFNQASTGTAVTDLTGGGANQTSIIGTTVSGSDPSPWTFDGIGATASDPEQAAFLPHRFAGIG